jgi:LuxR family transcriptional regulator, activator of conjugal transfer of Ti plasmids
MTSILMGCRALAICKDYGQMTPPKESLIAFALETLQSAKDHNDIIRGTETLTEGMGLQRYVIADVRAGLIAGVHHNGPAEFDDQMTIGADPILARARVSGVPFAWAADSGTWRDQNGSLGYRTGVAATFLGPSGSGCIAVVSGSGPSIPAEHEVTLLGYLTMAAIQIGAALPHFPRSYAASPFSARELDCLLYALAGRSAKETARALDIGARTVEQYLERARARLQAPTSYAAATIALRRGWLDLEQASELAGLETAAGARQVSGV